MSEILADTSQSCTCDDVTKALGGTDITCPIHGSAFALHALYTIHNLQSRLAAAEAAIDAVEHETRGRTPIPTVAKIAAICAEYRAKYPKEGK